MTTDLIIRRAIKQDTKLVSDILADAFTNDPVMNWMTDPKAFATLFKSEAQSLYMEHGEVYLAASQGAAMWLPPGVSPQARLHWSLLPLFWSLLRNGGIRSLRRGSALEKMFAENHYKKPHYYLLAIGSALDHQGKGVGSALLRAGLEVADRNHAEAYLESSNIKNNPLYERFGFRVTGELKLPENGPVVWQMLRDAR